MKSRVLSAAEYPQIKNVVRLQHADVTWRIVPLGFKRTLIENYAHIDPNGALPAWLTNMLIVDAPYKALKRLRSIVSQGKYDDAEIAFIEKNNP